MLHRHLGLDPEDALSRPAWVVDLLARGLAEELAVTNNDDGDGFVDVPDLEGV